MHTMIVFGTVVLAHMRKGMKENITQKSTYGNRYAILYDLLFSTLICRKRYVNCVYEENWDDLDG